jgi:hypothetical protein
MLPKEGEQANRPVSARPPTVTPHPHRMSVDRWLGIPRFANEVSYSHAYVTGRPQTVGLTQSSTGLNAPLTQRTRPGTVPETSTDPKRGHLEFLQGLPPQHSAIPHKRYPSCGPRPMSKEIAKRRAARERQSELESPTKSRRGSASFDTSPGPPSSPARKGFKGPPVSAYSEESPRRVAPRNGELHEKIQRTLTTAQTRYGCPSDNTARIKSLLEASMSFTSLELSLMSV